MLKNFKLFLSRYPAAYNGAKFALSVVQNIRRELGFISRSAMLDGELKFFRAMDPQISSIADVSARFDTDYLQISHGRNLKYFLFEASPQFYRRLKLNLEAYPLGAVTADNIAIGEREGFCDYFKDNESVLQSIAPSRTRRKSSEVKYQRDDWIPISKRRALIRSIS